MCHRDVVSDTSNTVCHRNVVSVISDAGLPAVLGCEDDNGFLQEGFTKIERSSIHGY